MSTSLLLQRTLFTPVIHAPRVWRVARPVGGVLASNLVATRTGAVRTFIASPSVQVPAAKKTGDSKKIREKEEKEKEKEKIRQRAEKEKEKKREKAEKEEEKKREAKELKELIKAALQDRKAIKRPITGYLAFSAAVRADNPSLGPLELAKLCGERWNALSAEEKAPYAADPQAYEVYRVKKEEWKQGLRPDVARALKKRAAARGKPTQFKGLTGLTVYVRDGDHAPTDRLPQRISRWNTFSETEKQVWMDKAKEENAKRNQAYEEYKLAKKTKAAAPEV